MNETIEKAYLSLQFSKQILNLFLEEGSLTKETLLNLYQGTKLKKQFNGIETEIEKFFAACP